jgi:hypothetical protein
MRAEMSHRAFFSICAAVDFVLGCIKWHSVSAGLLAIVFGLPLNALLFLVLRRRGKVNDGHNTVRK